MPWLFGRNTEQYAFLAEQDSAYEFIVQDNLLQV
jgi:hypothetical protein